VSSYSGILFIKLEADFNFCNTPCLRFACDASVMELESVGGMEKNHAAKARKIT